MGSLTKKYNVCLVGSGGVGTVAAIVLEKSGRAKVTAVLRSKFEVIKERGWDVDSVDHGVMKGWRPSRVVATIADAAVTPRPYDFIVVSTKQLPDVYSVADLISPLVTPFHTTIVLIQNGLDIEVALIAAFPTNTIVSSVSMIGSSTEGENRLRQIGPDSSIMGPHFHAGLPRETQLANATTFVELYRAGGANEVRLSENMPTERWRKLIWNGTFNTLCALMRMDVGELQSSGGRDTMLVPMMWEVWNIAKADGHQLPDDLVELQAYGLPDDCPYRPSMLLDVEHGRPMELEVILGNAIKRANALGVQAPKMSAVYGLLKMEQWKMNHIKKQDA